jgi:hypothetical protein
MCSDMPVPTMVWFAIPSTTIQKAAVRSASVL